MNIFPAIDLSGGKAVRLLRGDYDNMKIYSHAPCEVAQSFADCGAKYLHVVDLDGAKHGTAANFNAISEIVKQKELFVQVGGGIRTRERIEEYLSLGVKRVILGTVAVQNFDFTEEMVKIYGEAIAVGVDAKNNMAAINGWLETTAVPSIEFCKRCADAGVQTVIYTDISKDGALSGTNLEVYYELSEIKGLNIIASGGVTYIDEIKALQKSGLYGCIVGKAIYEGVLSLKECLNAAEGKEI